MASWTLNIEFGGLCMFVRRAPTSGKAAGVFVIMPRTQSPTPLHVPTLEFGEKNQPKIKVPLENVIHDFRTDFQASAGDVTNFDGFAPVSAFAENTVDESFLTGASTTGAMAARFELPFGASIGVTGDRGLMHPDKPGGKQGSFGGRANVVLTPIDDSKQKYQIAGVTIFKPKVATSLNLRIVNVPEAQLDCPRKEPHGTGEHSPHFAHYYDLIRPPKKKPLLLFDETTSGETDCEPTIQTLGSFQVGFVDPFACTTSFGCPDEDPGCTT